MDLWILGKAFWGCGPLAEGAPPRGSSCCSALEGRVRGVPPAVASTLGPHERLNGFGRVPGREESSLNRGRVARKGAKAARAHLRSGKKARMGQASPALPRLTVRKNETSHENSLDGTALGI